MSDTFKLMKLTGKMKSMYEEMVQDFQANNENRHWGDNSTFEDFVKKLDENERGINLVAGYVPSTTYWLVRNNKTMIGRSSLRHRLTPTLELEGGHIGYAVRPSERRKGYGTMILTLLLKKARAMGIDRVFVTCDTDNIGSAKIILKNGGLLENEAISARTGKPISRYWINLASTQTGKGNR